MPYSTNSRKHPSQHVYANTVIWQCSDCDCWSRIEFVHVDEPECPLCHGRMTQVEKSIRVE